MIEIQDHSSNSVRVIVRANRSMSWRANLILAASLGVVCLGMAVTMAIFGFWLILPFAGAELVLIIVCLYLTQRRLSRLEVITVDGEAIRLEWGYTQPDVTVDLPRQWVQLHYRCSESAFEVGHLSVVAHGRRYVLGSCLNREEKKALYVELQSAFARPVSRSSVL